SAGPHQPQRASAVVGAESVATAMVAAAATAVRVFLITSPPCESKGNGQREHCGGCSHAHPERGLNGCLHVAEWRRFRCTAQAPIRKCQDRSVWRFGCAGTVGGRQSNGKATERRPGGRVRG